MEWKGPGAVMFFGRGMADKIEVTSIRDLRDGRKRLKKVLSLIGLPVMIVGSIVPKHVEANDSFVSPSMISSRVCG